MTAAHYAAVKSLLADLPATLYDGQVPDRPEFPYAILSMDTGRTRDYRLTGRLSQRAYDFTVTSVGLTAESVRVVSDAVQDRLLNSRPAVAGFRCGLIRHTSSVPVRADTDVQDAVTRLYVMFAVDMFSFRCTPE